MGINGVGLVRFDGQNFETWAIDNEPPFNMAGQMVTGANGHLRFVHYWGMPEAGIYTDAEGKGEVWIGTENLEEKSPNGKWRQINTDDDSLRGNVLSITAAPDGSVWFGTWYNGLWKFSSDGNWQRFGPKDSLPGLAVFGTFVDPEGNLWVGTKGGIARYVPE